MTAKCCRECVFLSPQRRCMVTDKGNPRPFYSSSGGGGIIIKNPDTFYCAAFARRNSAKPIDIPIEYERDIDGEIVGYKDPAKPTGQTEENVENTAENIPPIQRRFV